MNDATGMPQSVLVLGGGSDIARAILRPLIARRTTTVVLAGRSGSASLAEAEAEARKLGATTVETIDFDAGDPASIPAAIDRVWARYPDIDLAIVAFGLLGDQAAMEADPGLAVEVATVNYTAAVCSGLALAGHFRTQGHGVIVALSSVAGERVRRSNFVYGSTKAGMDGFYQGLGDALVGSGARVMVVRPGFVDTKMTAGLAKVPLATTSDAVANSVVRALSSGAETVWVPATFRPVMSALRHLPRVAFRRIPA